MNPLMPPTATYSGRRPSPKIMKKVPPLMLQVWNRFDPAYLLKCMSNSHMWAIYDLIIFESNEARFCLSQILCRACSKVGITSFCFYLGKICVEAIVE